ncbi:hypothetical protein GCM10009809_08190 [Isoptericola hypogeus]|uniref:Uncharacterized protein n=1 Tax=Isoptericola hypogeus TaxID=300179 RepID=A0ABN2IYV3_9MICO
MTQRKGRPRQGGPSDITTTTLARNVYVVDEPSHWLRARVGELLRRLDALPLPRHDLVVTPLGRTGHPGSREDRCCDRCRRYTPPGRPFYVVRYRPRPRVEVAGGLCATCARAEGVETP